MPFPSSRANVLQLGGEPLEVFQSQVDLSAQSYPHEAGVETDLKIGIKFLHSRQPHPLEHFLNIPSAEIRTSSHAPLTCLVFPRRRERERELHVGETAPGEIA